MSDQQHASWPARTSRERCNGVQVLQKAANAHSAKHVDVLVAHEPVACHPQIILDKRVAHFLGNGHRRLRAVRVRPPSWVFISRIVITITIVVAIMVVVINDETTITQSRPPPPSSSSSLMSLPSLSRALSSQSRQSRQRRRWRTTWPRFSSRMQIGRAHV